MKKRSRKIVVFGICFLMTFTQFVPVFALDEEASDVPAATEATAAPEPEQAEPTSTPEPEQAEPTTAPEPEQTEPTTAPKGGEPADDPGDANGDSNSGGDSDANDDADAEAGAEDPSEATTEEATEETTEPTEEPSPAFQASIDTGTVKITMNVPKGAFPEKVKVKSHKVSAGKVKDTVEEELGEEAGDLSAVDISFHNEAGRELEPDKAVTLKVNAYGLDGEGYRVVHIADSGAADVVASSEGSRFSFKADEFSIYTIVGTEGGKVRRTYNFYNGDELVDSQIVKNGDRLVEPSVPASGKEGEEFLGWSADGGTTFQKFDAPIRDIDDSANKDETVDLYACFETNLAVIFHDRNGSVIETVYGKAGDKVSVDDVSFEVMAGEYVSGWTTDPEGTPQGEVTGSVTLKDENIDLYPIIKDVHWLIFHDKGLDDDPSIPTHTEAYYLRDGQVTTRPADPTRPGYTFREWTTDPEGNNAFAFGEPLAKDTVVYGQWDPEEADYEVLVWSESLVNGKYVEGNYALSDHYTFTAPTRSEVSLSESDDLVQELIASKAYRHHEFKEIDGPAIVKGDGTTVLNVYFDLKVYKIEFQAMPEELHQYQGQMDLYGGVIIIWYVKTNSWQPYQRKHDDIDATFTHDGITYHNYDVYTIKARFGEDIASRWPDYHTGRTQCTESASDEVKRIWERELKDGFVYCWGTQDKNMQTGNAASSLTPTTNLTETHINADGGDTIHYFLEYGSNPVIKGANYWLENVENEEFSRSNSLSLDIIVANLVPKDIDGFTLIGRSNSPETPTGYDPSGTYDGKYEFNFYYTRNHYPLRFYNYNKVEKEYAGDDAIKYEALLSSYEYTPEKPAELPDEYIFGGWYTTQECYEGTEFSFDGATMPIDGLTLYAKWAAPKYTVTFDSNGGTEVPSQTVDYGKKAAVPEPPEREGFTFSGWIKGESPFNFNTKIYADTNLTARWLSDESIQVVYDAGEHGSNPPTDRNTYADVSRARVQSSPDVDEGYRFTGWKCGETVHYPGNLFTVRSSDAEKVADNRYRITLQAVYEQDVPEVRIIYYRNHPGISGGDEACALTEKMPNNDTLTLADPGNLEFEGGGAAPAGWHFLYWAENPDGSGKHFKPGDIVAADFIGDNVLYAIWKADECTITYDPNGGTFRESAEPTDIGVHYGQEITIAEAAVRPGYEFLYWKGSEYQPGDKYTVEGDHTFTAMWKKAADPAPAPDDPTPVPADPPEEPAEPDTPVPTDPTTWVTDPGDKAKDKSSETGDESQLLLPLVLAIASITTLGALAITGRRRRREH